MTPTPKMKTKMAPVVMTSEDLWKSRLAESTGQWAFVLSLSRRMISALELICASESQLQLGMHFATVFRALERRGLVEFKLRDHVTECRWELTAAGECVVQLLKHAGQFKKLSVAKPV